LNIHLNKKTLYSLKGRKENRTAKFQKPGSKLITKMGGGWVICINKNNMKNRSDPAPNVFGFEEGKLVFQKRKRSQFSRGGMEKKVRCASN